MLIAIWDFLFTRRIWKEIQRVSVYDSDVRKGDRPIRYELWLQDQFGNIKKVKM